MTEPELLEQAIAQLEAQRVVLGDATVNAAVAALRQKLADLDHLSPAPHLSATSEQQGERKLVTILFADLSGFTALAEKLDPEAVRALVNACFERLAPVIRKYQGTIEKFIGDEIMALFGAPVAHENDAKQALCAALEMLHVLADFNAEHGTDLGMHFGINTGHVVAGALGVGEDQQYGVMGDAVNAAARLEDASKRGQILVGPDTYRLTDSLFEFETLPPIRLKGKSESLPIYRVIDFKSKPLRSRGLGTQGISSPLVGRDAQLATLRECVERLIDGRGGIVSVVGEAGMGKSRLMAELRKSVPAERLHWLEGQALSFGQTISYWPFREILHAYAGITEEDSEAERWQKLECAVTESFAGETPEVLPYLASLLTLEVKGEYTERVKYLDGEAMGHQLFLVARRFFERLAQAMPVVLVFEDLHWADESSALLLEHLLPLVERAPLLLCGVSRPDPATPAARLREVAAKDYAHCYTEIRLAPLSEGDSATLIRNLLAIENLSPRVHDMIVHRAEGNPFFLEEIIRSLIDAGAVVRDPTSGRWRATAQVETLTIPDTVQGVITARIDRLDEDLRQLLKTAAVIGRSFMYRVLSAIAAADRELDRHLSELEAVEFIREKQRIPELEYIFKHALVQETTYESILLQRRRELHAQVARVIETLFAERLDDFYSLLAYHYARGEAWEKAQEYLLKSADQAGRLAADAEALAHYQQAMDVYSRVFGDKWDPLQRASLERKMGEAFYRRGDHRQALAYLQRALNYLGKPLPVSTWGVRLALLREVVRQIGHRLFPHWFVKSDCDSVSSAVEEEFQLCNDLFWIDVLSNPERCPLLVFRNLNLSESHGYRRGIALSAMATGVICDLMLAFSLAEPYIQRGLALAAKVQDPFVFGQVCTGLSQHYIFLGNWNHVSDFTLQAAEKTRAMGDLHPWAYTTYQIIQMQYYCGAFSEALGLAQDLVRLGKDVADRQMESWGLAEEGLIQYRLGHLNEAIVASQQAAELARALPDTAFTISATADLGRSYLRQGNLIASLATFEASQKAFLPNLGGDSYASLRNGRAEAFLLAAEQSAGVERTGWLKKAGRACREALKQEKEFRPGLPEAMRLQGTYEWLRGRRVLAEKWWKRSLALAEKMGQHYDAGMTHLEIGLRMQDRAHLERAETIFAEIGAEFDLARAREALSQASVRP